MEKPKLLFISGQRFRGRISSAAAMGVLRVPHSGRGMASVATAISVGEYR